MMGRVALGLSFTAIVFAVACLVLLGEKLSALSKRVAAIESRPAPAPAPPPSPAPPTEPKETPEEANRRKIREVTNQESEEYLKDLLRSLDLAPSDAQTIRDALAEEFKYYADGVLRAVEGMKTDSPKDDANWLTSREFRRGIEERIDAADEKIKQHLDPARTSRYEAWRMEIRKTRYGLTQ